MDMEGNINVAIEQISEKLGLAITDISQLMPQLVKQKIIHSSIICAIDLIFLVIGIIVVYFGVRRIKQESKKWETIEKIVIKNGPHYLDWSQIETNELAFIILTSISFPIAVLFGVFLINDLSTLIAWIVAPEFNFFKYVIGLI